MSHALDDNLKKAHDYLGRFKTSTLGHRIAGKAHTTNTAKSFENLSPIDGSTINTVYDGSVEDVDLACRASADAFSEWRSFSAPARRKLLHKVADAIEARAEEIAFVECMDTGQALRFMSKAALRGAENYRFFADKVAQASNGLSLPAAQHMNYTVRSPIGPVGVITPWNTPFMLSTWKIAPALAAGCTVVHKPAEWSPLTATLLSEIMTEAGVPDGVVNLVNGSGEIAGKALTEHPAINAIAFVGDTNTGQLIQAQGAPTLKRVHFELGGKNPVVVFDDANLSRALDAAVFMIYSLNGERCTSSSRLLVQESIYDTFVEQVQARAKKLKVGHPLDPTTEVGPLIHKNHLEKVCGYFEVAKKEGAITAAGGRVSQPVSGGYFVEPTLFTQASAKMAISQQEIFGPVLTAIPFKDEADALSIANNVPYGLAAYLWTSDVGRAHRFAHAVDAGMVWVNSENNRHLQSPFGGVKASGIGRDGGDYSFDFYMETKNICIAYDSHSVPVIGA